MEKYKVGDKVKIRSDRGDYWNPQGEMDKYCGKTLTIKSVMYGLYSMKESKHFVFDDSDIVALVKR